MDPSRFAIASTILIVTCAVVTAGMFAPDGARAGGYNDSGYNYSLDADSGEPGGNAGLYVRDPRVASQNRSYQGPHGGYTTTTNKCQDCHAVHLASGAFMLMRSDTRENACDFCHAGGGGSALNVQMDNAYDADGLVAGNTAGQGTGHTIGYAGLSPLDIKPAYWDTAGLVCFDCHTPHGASTRVLTTFADPGRRSGGSYVSEIHTGSTLVTVSADPAGIDLATYSGGAGSYWGPSVDEGNLVSVQDGNVTSHPIYPTGRFLLLGNPHATAAEFAEDTVTGSDPGSALQLGYNKIAIDWDAPLGPADSGDTGDQDATHGGDYFGSTGLMSLSEFCTDCHDGAAGASTQTSTVWQRSGADGLGGTYVTAYSHDSQPRGYLRQLVLEPGGTPHNPDGTDDNFGPNCRQCHIGGSSCDQCHGLDASGDPRSAYQVYTPVSAVDTPQPAAGVTPYWAQASIGKSAIAGLSGQCIDGGFSYPHRTLGTNLLGDELYGVDFDGSPIGAGVVRMDPDTLVAGFLDDQPYASEPTTDTWKLFDDASPSIAGQAAENMDSACITCHGDGTFWNGDDPAYRVIVPSPGWELTLKGLP